MLIIMNVALARVNLRVHRHRTAQHPTIHDHGFVWDQRVFTSISSNFYTYSELNISTSMYILYRYSALPSSPNIAGVYKYMCVSYMYVKNRAMYMCIGRAK
jgi:hypothetical protein